MDGGIIFFEGEVIEWLVGVGGDGEVGECFLGSGRRVGLGGLGGFCGLGGFVLILFMVLWIFCFFICFLVLMMVFVLGVLSFFRFENKDLFI